MLEEQSNEESVPESLGVDWERLRKFLRSEIKQEVRVAMTPVTARIEAHDARLALVETSVRSIETSVNAGRWETANITGMLTGFIGTKEVTGKFDVAMDGIKATAERASVQAERANTLSHETRGLLQVLSDKIFLEEQAEVKQAAEDEKQSEKRTGWLKWLMATVGGSGLVGWVVKHFQHGPAK